jgi:MFS family permease
MVGWRQREPWVDPDDRCADARAAALKTDRLPHGALWAAMTATSIGVLPVFFFGALAALIRDDLGFGQSQIGLATATFFATGAVLSVPCGRLAERLGEVRTTAVAVGCAAGAMLGMAVLAHSWAQLLPLMLLGGVGNAAVQPATNGMLAGVVPERHQGLVFGAKQAAVPLASTVAGFGLPVLGLTLGWRGAFGVAAALALPVLALLWRVRHRHRRSSARSRSSLRVSKELYALAVVAALGAGSGNAMGAFYVDAAVDRGIAAGTAGVFLALSAATGIAARVLLGWWTDRWRIRRLRVVVVMLAAGAGGYAVIAAGAPAAVLLAGTVTAYAAGWGWNGLLVAAVIDAHPQAPAAATGITQAGVYGGAVLIPPLFGYIAEAVSYPAAWATAATLLCCAACLAAVAVRWHAQVMPARSAR